MRRFLSVLINGWLFLETVYLVAQSVFVFGGSGLPVAVSLRAANSLRYFTNQSNLLIALAALIYGVALQLKLCRVIRRVPAPVRWLKYMATVSICLTLAVVACWLGPRWGYDHVFNGTSLWLHLLNPLLAALDWCVLDRQGRLPFRATFAALVPVALYGVGYVWFIVRDGVAGNDLYGFASGGALMLVAALAALVLGAWLIALALWLPRRTRKKKGEASHG